MTDKQFKEVRNLLRDIYEELVHLRSPEAVITWDEDKDGEEGE